MKIKNNQSSFKIAIKILISSPIPHTIYNGFMMHSNKKYTKLNFSELFFTRK